MIKSQLLCQLSYAPACEEAFQKGNRNYNISATGQMTLVRDEVYSICTSCPSPTGCGGTRMVCGARQKSIYDT